MLERELARAERLGGQFGLVMPTWTAPRPTASLGLAMYPDNALSAAELLRAADAALYRAKAEGRNRLVVA